MYVVFTDRTLRAAPAVLGAWPRCVFTLPDHVQSTVPVCPVLPSRLQSADEEHRCETLYECFFFTLTSGLRSPGGIGEAMVLPSFAKEDSLYFWRLVFDLTFFGLLIILILNAGMHMQWALVLALGLVS
jgi:hypothetical protein